MGMSKLVSLLTTQSLFFTRADRFLDRWEGSVSPNDVSAWNEQVEKSDESREEQEKLIRNYPHAFKGFPRHTYISCWHRNYDGESDAMWKLYMKSYEAIALQTSVKHLHCELNKSNRRILLGNVAYCDYRKQSIAGSHSVSVGNAYAITGVGQFISKRLGFRHENEFRALFQDEFTSVDDPSEAEYGLLIGVDVKSLIEAVFVAPGTRVWLREAVQSLLHKFGIDRNVRPSEFDELPPY